MKTETPVFTPTLRTRRVVTGHDADGKSIIASDGICDASMAIGHPDLVLTDAWRCDQLPADNKARVELPREVDLQPANVANLVRIVQFPPDRDYISGIDSKAVFSAIGESGSQAAADFEGAPHPLMHRTNSVDYIFVISGEIYAVMERGELLLHAGDVLIQRGTNHAWSNRSKDLCVLGCVINAAEPR